MTLERPRPRMARRPTGAKPASITAADRRTQRELELNFEYMMLAAQPPRRGPAALYTFNPGDMARRVARRYRELTGFGILSHNGIQKR